MAWDSTRQPPWRKLARDWCIYAVLALIGMVIWTQATDRAFEPGLVLGLIASGPLFIILGAVLAKFGYQRKTLKELRAEDAAKAREKALASAGNPPRRGTARARPAPTGRTGGTKAGARTPPKKR